MIEIKHYHNVVIVAIGHAAVNCQTALLSDCFGVSSLTTGNLNAKLSAWMEPHLIYSRSDSECVITKRNAKLRVSGTVGCNTW